ncbi:MAG: HEAT repeat domain-containing protein, partial [Acidobacteriota bacterium]
MLFFTLRQLKSSDESKRIEALERLRDSKDPRAVEHLILALADSSSLVRMTAVDALVQFADKRAIPSLLTLLSDDAPGVRQSAAVALNEYKDDLLIQSLIPLLNDEDSNVRRTAADALKKNRSHEIEQALAEYHRIEVERKRSSDELKTKVAQEKEQQKIDAKSAAADQKMIQKLLELATHYAGGGIDREKPWLAREVQEIGRTLHTRGGIREMERVWLKMPLVEGKREVELQWNSIGDWSRR